MKRPSPYTCDVCNADKMPSNNWWLVYFDVERREFHQVPWRDGEADREEVKHICGRECAGKALAKFMEAAG